MSVTDNGGRKGYPKVGGRAGGRKTHLQSPPWCWTPAKHRPQAGLSGSLFSFSVRSTLHHWEPEREAWRETDKNLDFSIKMEETI